MGRHKASKCRAKASRVNRRGNFRLTAKANNRRADRLERRALREDRRDMRRFRSDARRNHFAGSGLGGGGAYAGSYAGSCAGSNADAAGTHWDRREPQDLSCCERSNGPANGMPCFMLGGFIPLHCCVLPICWCCEGDVSCGPCCACSPCSECKHNPCCRVPRVCKSSVKLDPVPVYETQSPVPATEAVPSVPTPGGPTGPGVASQPAASAPPLPSAPVAPIATHITVYPVEGRVYYSTQTGEGQPEGQLEGVVPTTAPAVPPHAPVPARMSITSFNSSAFAPPRMAM